MIAFILRHGAERAPACVQDGLRLVGFRKSRGVHVANEDRTVALNKPSAEFVVEIFAPVGNLAVNRLDAAFLVRTLNDGQFRLQRTEELFCWDDDAIASPDISSVS